MTRATKDLRYSVVCDAMDRLQCDPERDAERKVRERVRAAFLDYVAARVSPDDLVVLQRHGCVTTAGDVRVADPEAPQEWKRGITVALDALAGEHWYRWGHDTPNRITVPSSWMPSHRSPSYVEVEAPARAEFWPLAVAWRAARQEHENVRAGHKTRMGAIADQCISVEDLLAVFPSAKEVIDRDKPAPRATTGELRARLALVPEKRRPRP